MANAALKRRRPKYLSLAALLFQLRLPLPGKVSILHRISGALLVFPLAAWLLYLLDQSLASEEGFNHIKDHYLQAPLAKAGGPVFLSGGFPPLFPPRLSCFVETRRPPSKEQPHQPPLPPSPPYSS